MRPTIRCSNALLLAFALTVAPWALAGDKYPSKPVTVIVPQGPGGGTDSVARIVLQKMSENLGQTFVVDNRAGAGGNIGTALAAKAPKDGYTLLLTLSSSHVVNPSLYKNAGFDPVKDFEPITPVATVPYLLVAIRLSGEERQGADRSGQVQAGLDQLRVRGQRHAQPSAGRDAEDAGEDRPRARALQSRRRRRSPTW